MSQMRLVHLFAPKNVRFSKSFGLSIWEIVPDGEALLYRGSDVFATPLGKYESLDDARQAIAEARTGYPEWDAIGKESASILCKDDHFWTLVELVGAHSFRHPGIDLSSRRPKLDQR